MSLTRSEPHFSDQALTGMETPNPGKVRRDIALMNSGIVADLQGLLSIPRIYHTLFHRTRKFAATVRDLAAAAPTVWAVAACLLVDWSVNVLRHRDVGLERFLHSQRRSLYWLLDDALLRICVDQWDPSNSSPMPSTTLSSQSRRSSSSSTEVVPWNIVMSPITQALSSAHLLLPGWIDQDLEELRKWRYHVGDEFQADRYEEGWFGRSKKFLSETTRIHEIWRTIKLCGGGQLPVELANVIVEDVSTFERLPMGSLRDLYFSKSN
jgi:hypothetical protein